MVKYKLLFSKRANKDRKLLKQSHLDKKAGCLLDIIVDNPFKIPPRYEKLTGDLGGFYSRRINLQHRLVYYVDDNTKEIIIVRMWTHYGE